MTNERKQIYRRCLSKNHSTAAPAHLLPQRLPAVGLLALLAAPTRRLAAKTFSLNENGDLHLTSKQGFTLNEQGPASGTVSGTLYVHLKIVSSTHVTAEISLYPHGGSITCSGSAAYKREGSIANFSGCAVDRSRHRQLCQSARVWTQLQRHDPTLQRRDHRARRRHGLRVEPTPRGDDRSARASRSGQALSRRRR